MSLFEPILDATFREYADLEFRRHLLLLEGKEQEPGFDAIEDRMTGLWETLNASQRQSLKGMGSDLNWIRRRALPPNGRKPEETTTAERQDLLRTRKENDWHGFLHSLRECAPIIPPSNLAYLRGTAYDAIEFPDFASSFYEHAADLEPANASMGVIAMRAMEHIDPSKALRRAKKIVANSVRFPPAVVAFGTVIALRSEETEGHPIEKNRFTEILQDAIRRLQLEPPSDAGRAMTYQLAASGFEILDDLPSALQCYEDGLKHSPDDEVLLIGKGLLLYGAQTARAIEAFGRVLRNEGSSLVWPYFFLAHHAMLLKNHDEALKLIKQALTRATSKPVRAELLEWQAICFSERGFPLEMVRAQFEKAMSQDASNGRIRKNSEAFEEALILGQETNWKIESENTLRVDRSSSMRELHLVSA